jgi:septal ring factor EnvC (AmiA/AmiB activator)
MMSPQTTFRNKSLVKIPLSLCLSHTPFVSLSPPVSLSVSLSPSSPSPGSSVLQSVSQSSQDKITKLENELNAKIDENSVQRKALETSWNDNNDLKRTLAEIKAECENLRSQIGFGKSLSPSINLAMLETY